LGFHYGLQKALEMDPKKERQVYLVVDSHRVVLGTTWRLVSERKQK
jgi:hypothetical protein